MVNQELRMLTQTNMAALGPQLPWLVEQTDLRVPADILTYLRGLPVSEAQLACIPCCGSQTSVRKMEPAAV